MGAPTPYTSSPTKIYALNATQSSGINALLGGVKWGTSGVGTSATVYYSFPVSNNISLWDQRKNAYTYAPGYEIYDGFSGLDLSLQSIATGILQSWANVANIRLVEVENETKNAVGDIRIAFTSSGFMTPQTYAYTYAPGPSYGGDIWINSQQPNASGNNYAVGGGGYHTLLHEIGHALGLAHPFEGLYKLPKALDHYQYTVMSYSDAPNHLDEGTSSFYPTTPMLLDIKAIQYIYGANMEYHKDDDLYVFLETETYYQAIWDAGGMDTMQYLGTADVQINLNAGSFSRLGQPISLSNGQLQYDTVAIAYNVTIENAIGGDGNDILSGNRVANELTGNAGNDTLDGKAGADTMIGGIGDDTYYVDHIADNVVELDDEGNDTLYSSISFNLATKAAFVENLYLTGKAVSGTGNNLDNILTGNQFNNILNGGSGIDTLIGGKGNDVYFVDHINDKVIETYSNTLGGGIDTVYSSVSYILDQYTDHLTLTDGSLNGGILPLSAWGNSLNNRLIGNAGNNPLIGEGGNDTLIGNDGDDLLIGGEGVDQLYGGQGNDTYVLELIQTGTKANSLRVKTIDMINELANAGEDRVILNGEYVHLFSSLLKLGANLEQLDASQTGLTRLNLTGNSLANILTGNDADNILNGGAGNDTLIGGDGNDTLDGSTGVDNLAGGDGDDTYIVDIIASGTKPNVIANLQDSITELADEGHDTLKLRGSLTTLTNPTLISLSGDLAQIEHLDIRLTASSRLDLEGNTADNILTGNSASNTLTGFDGNDILDGRQGADTLVGGLGDDTYYVDHIADSVVELDDEGNDTLYSSISFNLATKAAFVENLYLTGKAMNGTGNDLDNNLSGNQNNNFLDGGLGQDTINGYRGHDRINGGDGNDTLIGGSGNDVLTGGIGADTFVWELTDKGAYGTPSIDRITDFRASENDTLDLKDLLNGESVAADNLLNYIDITTRAVSGTTHTEIRISTDGRFADGQYALAKENVHITLSGINLFSDTGTSTEAELLQHLVQHSKLIVDA